MIKQDEIDLMVLMIDEFLYEELDKREPPRYLYNALSIPEKRACYILDKWSDKGIYEYGYCIDMGWLTEDVTEIIKRNGAEQWHKFGDHSKDTEEKLFIEKYSGLVSNSDELGCLSCGVKLSYHGLYIGMMSGVVCPRDWIIDCPKQWLLRHKNIISESDLFFWKPKVFAKYFLEYMVPEFLFQKSLG